jgi:hypothetical protein
MMKITGLSHVFKWENLHKWWLTKYFFAVYTVCRERTDGQTENTERKEGRGKLNRSFGVGSIKRKRI